MSKTNLLVNWSDMEKKVNKEDGPNGRGHALSYIEDKYFLELKSGYSEVIQELDRLIKVIEKGS